MSSFIFGRLWKLMVKFINLLVINELVSIVMFNIVFVVILLIDWINLKIGVDLDNGFLVCLFGRVLVDILILFFWIDFIFLISIIRFFRED